MENVGYNFSSNEVQIFGHCTRIPVAVFLETSLSVKNLPYGWLLESRFGTSFLSLLIQIQNLQHKPGQSYFKLEFIAFYKFL